MGKNIYKLTKNFDDVMVVSILWRHYQCDVKKVEGFRGFLLNISKMVQLIFTKLKSFLGNYV